MKKKLSLKKVTVANLTESQLDSVKGGREKTYECHYTDRQWCGSETVECDTGTLNVNCTYGDNCTAQIFCKPSNHTV